jgi:hypothetical protein
MLSRSIGEFTSPINLSDCGSLYSRLPCGIAGCLMKGIEMSDPVTIGGLVAATLALAAETGFKGVVGEAVKDAYKKLKDKVAVWAGEEVATLEAAPSSEGKQLAVAEIIDDRPENERKELSALAKILVMKLREGASAVGLDIGRLTALEVQLGNITVASGVGVRLHEANVEVLRTGNISVGDRGK